MEALLLAPITLALAALCGLVAAVETAAHESGRLTVAIYPA